MQISPKDHPARNIYTLLTSCVVPRPIAWISTLSSGGIPNLAPFSFYNAISSSPPLLSIAIARRKGTRKDTAENASRTGEFVVNIVSEKHIDTMVQTSGDHPPDVNEFDIANIATIPSVLVKPPRVLDTLVQMECKTHSILEISPGIVDLIIGEVVMFHIDASLHVHDNLAISAHELRPLARLGGDEYAMLGEIVIRSRPVV